MPPELSSVVKENGHPPVKRKSMPKVRTGCLTCRKRHTKCDEVKPECHRCRTAGRQCLGFGYSTTISPYSSHRHKPLLGGSSNHLESSNARLRLALPRPRRYIVPSVSLPCTDTEFRYFSLFQHRSAKDLAGYFPSRFWDRLLLQEAHSNAGIRNGVIAIGALYRMVDASWTSPGTSAAKIEALRHFQSALQHYQRAIHEQRDALQVQDSPEALRTCLISCLLFVCFEIFQGDCASVEKQVLSGLRLLQAYSSTSNEMPVDSIEGELCQIFARLEVQLRTYDDSRPQSYCLPRMEPKNPPSAIPGADLPNAFARFETLGEARRSWDLLMPKIMETHHRGYSYRSLVLDDRVPQEIQFEVANQLQELDAWNSCFEPIFHQAWTGTDSSARLGVSILKISWLFAHMMSSTTLSHLETSYDVLLPTFHQIVHLASHVARQDRPPSSLLGGDTVFVFDCALVLPVLFVVMKCRFWDLRHAAIDLLRATKRREGIWDSNVAAGLGAWLAAVEEEGLRVGEFVPEERRVRMVDLNFDLQKRTAWAQCGRPLSGMNDFSHLRETKFSW